MPPLNTQKQQQELFDEFVVVKKTRGRFFGVLNKFDKQIFPQYRLALSIRYETLFIILIGVALVAAIIFSLGVERGRSLNSADVEAPAPVEPVVEAPSVKPAPLPVAEAPKTLPKAPEPVKTVAVKPVVSAAASAADKPFTIQVASYKGRDAAEKELSRVKATGYTGEIIKKGNYFILCVGSFATKDAAKQTLAAMGKKYKGCLVRKR
ncbi:MAG: SPOR domain-containing protein [Candidatus Omnitrophica bacterium]|nr:SPOR domain-containing protein [Candidatus Omnitrophota bacterium]